MHIIIYYLTVMWCAHTHIYIYITHIHVCLYACAYVYIIFDPFVHERPSQIFVLTLNQSSLLRLILSGHILGRPLLSFVLIVVFGIYGLVYLGRLHGLVPYRHERIFFVTMNFTTKLFASMTLAGIRSSEFQEVLLTMLANTQTSFKRAMNIEDQTPLLPDWRSQVGWCFTTCTLYRLFAYSRPLVLHCSRIRVPWFQYCNDIWIWRAGQTQRPRR